MKILKNLEFKSHPLKKEEKALRFQKLMEEFSSEKDINFEVKQIVLKNNDIFFRVINDVTLSLADAKAM